MNFYVIIPASGIGKRFGSKIPKQFVKINGVDILSIVLNRFNSCKKIKSIFISTKKEYILKVKNICIKNNFDKVGLIITGGKLRQDSVYNALKMIDCNDDDRIIVHDAVRPFLSKKLLEKLIDESKKYDCVVPGIKLTNTIKKTDEKGNVLETISRENLWSIQTPQIFNYSKLIKAFEISNKDGYIGTDEASLMEYANFKSKVILGEEENIKITTKKDLKKK